MQKNVAYFKIALKKELRRKGGYLICVLMLACMMAMGQMQKPELEQRSVVILAPNPTEEATKLTDALIGYEGAFTFYAVASQKEFEKELRVGNAICGFVLSERYDELMEAGIQKECMTYYTMAETAKGRVAREVVYAAFFEQYSEWTMANHVSELKPQNESDFLASAKEEYHEYLQGDDLFRVAFVAEDASMKKEETAVAPCYPLEGLFMAFVFLRMLLTTVEWSEANTKLFLSVLPRYEEMRYRMASVLAAVAPLMVTGYVYQLLARHGQAAGALFVALLSAVLLGCLWTLLAAKLFQREKTRVVWITTFTVVSVLMSPVFVRLDQWVPAIGYVSRLQPVGWFLWLLEWLG